MLCIQFLRWGADKQFSVPAAPALAEEGHWKAQGVVSADHVALVPWRSDGSIENVENQVIGIRLLVLRSPGRRALETPSAGTDGPPASSELRGWAWAPCSRIPRGSSPATQEMFSEQQLPDSAPGSLALAAPPPWAHSPGWARGRGGVLLAHPSPDKCLTVYGLGPGRGAPRGIHQTPILGQWATLRGTRVASTRVAAVPGSRGSKGQHSPVNGVAPAAQLLCAKGRLRIHQLQSVEDHVHREHEGQRERGSPGVVAQLQPHPRASGAAGAPVGVYRTAGLRAQGSGAGERAVARRQGVQPGHLCARSPGCLESPDPGAGRAKASGPRYPGQGLASRMLGPSGLLRPRAPRWVGRAPEGLSLRRGCLSCGARAAQEQVGERGGKLPGRASRARRNASHGTLALGCLEGIPVFRGLFSSRSRRRRR